MAVPKKRTSSTRRDKRRSHHALRASNLSTCSNCGATRRSHRACPECGWYRGRVVISSGK